MTRESSASGEGVRAPWKAFNYVAGSYEIGRADNYAAGCIAVCHSKPHADKIVDALNGSEKFVDSRATLSEPSASTPAREGEGRTIDEYAYDELWGAIAAATRIDGGIVAISVVKFREAIRALDPAQPATGTDEGLRERIARIIDPFAWKEPPGSCAWNDRDGLRKRSLFKADTIVAALSADVTQRGGMEERESDFLTGFYAGAAHREFSPSGAYDDAAKEAWDIRCLAILAAQQSRASLQPDGGEGHA